MIFRHVPNTRALIKSCSQLPAGMAVTIPANPAQNAVSQNRNLSGIRLLQKLRHPLIIRRAAQLRHLQGPKNLLAKLSRQRQRNRGGLSPPPTKSREPFSGEPLWIEMMMSWTEMTNNFNRFWQSPDGCARIDCEDHGRRSTVCGACPLEVALLPSRLPPGSIIQLWKLEKVGEHFSATGNGSTVPNNGIDSSEATAIFPKRCDGNGS